MSAWGTPRAIAVADDSPAARAGIEPGDDVLTLNGERVPKTGTARWIMKSAKEHGTFPTTLTTRRNGQPHALTLYPVVGCSIPIVLQATPIPNAFSTGDKIVIQSGILPIARSDADLAVIIGHELAHANLGHLRKRKENALIGEIGGAVIDGGLLLGGINTRGVFMHHFEKVGARAYGIAFEREADYVGAYYAARAGYDISGAQNLWRAFAQEVPASIGVANDHPTSPARFVYMGKTIAEIEAKKRRHLPLIPELAPRTPLAAAAGF